MGGTVTSATEQLLRSFDARAALRETPVVARLVDTCIEAAKAAMVCSDACAPVADTFGLENCVHRTRAASDLCWSTAIALLHADAERDVLRPLIEACRVACDASSGSCSPHAPHHEFCRVCARECVRASSACGDLLALWDDEEDEAAPH
jgi:hypothetical protein